MNKALLDTDTLSEIGKAKDATVAANAKTYRRSCGHYTLSVVSVMEIVRGFQRTQATARLNAFLATLPHMEVLAFDQAAAELAGRIAGDRVNPEPDLLATSNIARRPRQVLVVAVQYDRISAQTH